MNKTSNKFLMGLAALLLAFSLYIPGLKGGFYLDDRQNLIENEAVQLTKDSPGLVQKALNSATPEAKGRRISMASFALQHAWQGGFYPFSLKLVNLVIHLLSGLVLFAVLIRFSQLAGLSEKTGLSIYSFSALTSLLWVLAPINVGPVLYIVQRMNLMSALFTLMSLLAYVEGRWFRQKLTSRLFLLFSSLITACIAFFSKENAVLLFVFLFGLEIVLGFQNVRSPGLAIDTVALFRLKRLVIIAFIMMSAAIYLLLVRDVPDFRGGFAIRDYEQLERVLIQPLIVINYLLDIVFPYPGGIRFNLDFYQTFLSEKYIALRLVSIAVVASLIVSALIISVKSRFGLLIYFSLGWFLCFHLLESTIIPLELAFNHRNYLPGIGIVAVIAGLILKGFSLQEKKFHVFIVAYVLAVIFTTFSESKAWGNAYLLYGREAEMQPVSVRANIGVAGLLLNFLNDTNEFEICPQVNAAYQRVIDSEVSPESAYHQLLSNDGLCGNNDFDHYLNQLSMSYTEGRLTLRKLAIFQMISKRCLKLGDSHCHYIERLIDSVKKNPAYQNNEHPYMDRMILIEAAHLTRTGNFQQAQQLVQSLLFKDPEHHLANFAMFNLVHAASGCSGVSGALGIASSIDSSSARKLVDAVTDNFEHCFNGTVEENL